MKILCPHCGSDQMDQGLDDTILCHNCGGQYSLVKKWAESIRIKDMEK